MALHDFLFTYSVHKRHDTIKSERLANQVRNDIAEINQAGLSKLKTVETAFVGRISLVGGSVMAKRDESEKRIKEVLKSVVNKHAAIDEVDVYIELMVDGLGSNITIYI